MIDEERLFGRGIPSTKGISISADLIKNNCAINDNFLITLRDEAISLIDLINKKHGFPFNILPSLLTFNIDENLVNHMCFDYDVIFVKALNLLNCPDEIYDIYDDEKVFNMARERVKVLSRVRIPNQLEKEFPELFEDYELLEKLAYEYKILSSEVNKREKIKHALMESEFVLMDKYKKRMETIKNHFARYDIRPREFCFKAYVDKVSSIFTRLFNKKEIYNIMDTIATYSIDIQKFDGSIDEDKFELLLAAGHLSAAFGNDTNRTENFSYVTSYFDSVKDDINNPMSVEMEIHNGGEMSQLMTITRKSLFSLYKKFLMDHPEVEILHVNREDFEGKSLEDIKEYIENYRKDIEVSWEILPSYDVTRESSVKELGASSLTDEERLKVQASKERIFDEKQEFYESHKPYCVIQGKNSFTGYIGYIYPNGKVILDQYYEINSNRIATSAIYVMDISEFIELSRKSKLEIIEGKLCRRIIHTEGWEERVEKEIKSLPSNQDSNEEGISPEVFEDIQIAINRLRYTK